VCANVMNGENMGMIKSHDRPGFGLKASQTVSIPSQRRRQHFDSNDAIQAGIARTIDFAREDR
jgi:hypothetical protein